MGSLDGSIKLIWLKSGTIFQTITAHDSYINDIHYLYGSRKLLSCSSDGCAKLWDPETPNLPLLTMKPQYIEPGEPASGVDYVVSKVLVHPIETNSIVLLAES